jgi:hypothetical protein
VSETDTPSFDLYVWLFPLNCTIAGPRCQHRGLCKETCEIFEWERGTPAHHVVFSGGVQVVVHRGSRPWIRSISNPQIERREGSRCPFVVSMLSDCLEAAKRFRGYHRCASDRSRSPVHMPCKSAHQNCLMRCAGGLSQNDYILAAKISEINAEDFLRKKKASLASS